MEEKKFDYNSFIGMILLAGILLWWINSNKEEITPETNIETVTVAKEQNSDAFENVKPILQSDSLRAITQQNKLGAGIGLVACFYL